MKYSLLATVGTAIVTLQSACIAIAKPTLYVFGDSLSDIGTLNDLTLGLVPPPPYWNGRFSSGPVWNEYLALKLGYNLYNKAVGGATSDNSKASILPAGLPIQIPSSQDQINWFKFLHPLYKLDSSRNDDIAALVVGANDYFGTTARLVNGSMSPQEFASTLTTSIVSQLKQLKDIGFKNIVLGNVAAIQYTPMAIKANTTEIAKTTVTLTNQLIQQQANAWAQTAGLTLFSVFDLGSLVGMVKSSTVSSALGLKNINDPCVNVDNILASFSGANFLQDIIDLLSNLSANICSNPTDYFFFDFVHPAERVQRLAGYFLYETIVALRSGSSFSLSEANLISIIQKYGLNSVAPKPASI
ncbi:hypothetical protein FBU59_000236 [Linderina macrospora]|uniref:Uncharacterized protein n=1 Tax=Linderina macrospora TaxID=4868 RepID=A0ACC1JHF1_9FUNG|nr:hypothetical protein FBU59_000236 [Linderina macrospora]